MAPRILDGWESPRPSQIHGWNWEYNRIIGQIDLEISTNEDLTEFEGDVFDGRDPLKIRKIAYDEFDEQWNCFTNDGDLIVSRPILNHEFNTIEELADFMVAKAEEIEAGRSA